MSKDVLKEWEKCPWVENGNCTIKYPISNYDCLKDSCQIVIQGKEIEQNTIRIKEQWKLIDQLRNKDLEREKEIEELRKRLEKLCHVCKGVEPDEKNDINLNDEYVPMPPKNRTTVTISKK